MGEEAVVDRIGARPAALDVVDPELIEQLGNRHLVGDGEIHPVGLAAVAQGGVVQIEPLGHGRAVARCLAYGRAPPVRDER